MFPYEIYEMFKNTFFYRTSLLWCLLLAVNSVNQWKHILKVYMLPRKKWHTWAVLLKLAFLDKDYSSEVFQTLLAVPRFSKVAGKSQKQSSRGVLLKRCSWKFRKPQVFSCEFCKIFKNTFFHRAPPVAASEKLKAEADVGRCSVKKVFLEISLNSQENACATVSFLQPGLQLY